jgi:LmbE family N-acetylglucosaminyl deacetylase
MHAAAIEPGASPNRVIIPTTTENEWLGALRYARRWQPTMRKTVVVAPHPDDEILGAGGLIAQRRRDGSRVVVVAVTDGEAAYPEPHLGSIRRCEQERALAALGLPGADIVRLELPDGDVSSHEETLVEYLRDILTPDAVLVAPWKFDSHPDHEACGRAALRAARLSGSRVISYLFWTWHQQRPDALLALNPKRFDLDSDLRMAKACALAEYHSQLERDAEEPILPKLLLAPARRPFETFIVHGE